MEHSPNDCITQKAFSDTCIPFLDSPDKFSNSEFTFRVKNLAHNKLRKESSVSSEDTCFTESEYVDVFSPDAKVAKQRKTAVDFPKNALRRMRRPLRKLKCIDSSNQ